MNAYCKHKVHQFYESYQKGTFDQDDVALFIVLTRDYSDKGSIVRELGDFLAHPDEKNRGIVLKNIRQAAADFEQGLFDYFYKEGFELPVFKGLGTHDELSDDLRNIFNFSGIQAVQINVNDEHFRDFVFCIIFLLSSFKLKLEFRLFELKVEYAQHLNLFISYESVLYPNHFARMRILSLRNVWVECPRGYGAQKYELEKYIARRFEEGFLGAIAYEDDRVEKLLSVIHFDEGTIWPLPRS